MASPMLKNDERLARIGQNLDQLKAHLQAIRKGSRARPRGDQADQAQMTLATRAMEKALSELMLRALRGDGYGGREMAQETEGAAQFQRSSQAADRAGAFQEPAEVKAGHVVLPYTLAGRLARY